MIKMTHSNFGDLPKISFIANPLADYQDVGTVVEEQGADCF